MGRQFPYAERPSSNETGHPVAHPELAVPGQRLYS